MQIFFDFFPIIFFFIAYKFFGIFVATAVAIVASFLQLGLVWIKFKKIEFLYILTFILILVLGGATLAFHNAMFIKWKPTAIYWAFAVCFLLSQFFGKKNLTERMLEKKISLPSNVWLKLNVMWVLFFIFLGALNLFVVYNFSTNTWVNFKLFGLLGLMLIFGIVQSLYIGKYLK